MIFLEKFLILNIIIEKLIQILLRVYFQIF